jgi:PAS domain S-box-containing protein
MPKDYIIMHARLRRGAVWQSCFLGALLAVLAAGGAVGAAPKQVLLLHSFGREFAPFNTVSESFRTELGQQLNDPVEFHDVALESARFEGEAPEGPLVDYLTALFAQQRLDLVVTIGGPAALYAQKYRPRLFPSAPMLIAAVDERLLQTVALTTNDAVVAVTNNLVGIMDGILQVFPETTNVAVVLGNSPLEKFWLGETRRQFQPFTNRVSFTWFNDLSFAEVLKRAAALPPRSVIYYSLMSVDAEGVPYVEERALRELHAVANAPIFGLHDSQMGRGIVGGPLMAIEELSRNAAKVAVRILKGEPAGSVIRFRQPTFWELYRWPLAGAVSFCLLQAALIVSLLINRAKRRQGEAIATLTADLSSKFINLPAGEVDREIEDAQRRVCECLGLDLSALWQWTDETPRDLRLTHLYRPLGGPPTPERFDSRETFPWCVRQLLDGKTVAVSSMESLPPEAARDKELWHYFGIKSNLTFPLSAGGGQIVGALGFNTMREERAWPEEIVKRLQLVAQIFASALARKRADQELRESEERFRLLMEQAPEAIVVMDPEQNRLVQANAQAERLFGCSRQELLAAGPQRFYTPEQSDGEPIAESMRAHSERALRGETVVFERTLFNALGRQFDCEVRMVRLPAGARKLVRASFIDITATKQSETALRDLSGRLIDAQEQERARVARELHDGLSQDLALQAVELELMGQRPPAAAEITSRMQELSAQMKKLFTEVHRISHDLHPAKLTQLGLTAAIAELCHAGLAVHQIPISFDHNGIPRSLPLGVALCLYRVAQECIQNAVKHSGAKQVGVELMTVDNEIHLSVADDGSGFDVESKGATRALGLVSMRERVRLVQGQIRIESKPGKGTRVTVRIPVPEGTNR